MVWGFRLFVRGSGMTLWIGEVFRQWGGFRVQGYLDFKSKYNGGQTIRYSTYFGIFTGSRRGTHLLLFRV